MSFSTRTTQSPKSVDPANIRILKSKNQRKSVFKEIQRKERLAVKNNHGRDSFKTFRSLTLKHDRLVERIYKEFDLELKLVKNIVIYAKNLPKPGSDFIDKSIFDGQMRSRFNLTNQVLLDRMFAVSSIDVQKTEVYIEDFIELLCILLTEIKDLKIQFVFLVYNWNEDGQISRRDMEFFLKPMVAAIADSEVTDVEFQEEEENNALKEFSNMLMNICDRNHDGNFDLDEFRVLVKENVLMMECLGPCLPSEMDRLRFREQLMSVTEAECHSQFQFERRKTLRSPKPIGSEKIGINCYYPMKLEIP